MQKFRDKYRVQVRIGDEVKGSVWDRKEDAEKEERELKREQEFARAGLEKPKDKILLLDYSASWFRARLKTHPVSTTSVEDSRLRLYILPYFGKRPMLMIKSSEVRDFLDEIQDEYNLSKATRNRIRALMHTMFQDAFMDSKIDVNPITRVPLLEENPAQAVALTQEEQRKLIAQANIEGHPWDFCVMAMLYTGGRVSQIAALKNKDFDVKNDDLIFARLYEQETHIVRDGIKGNLQGIVMPLFPILKEAFEAHLCVTSHKRPDDYCFVDDTGELYGTYILRNRVKALCEAAEIRIVTPHILRATFATNAEEAGYSKEDLQRMLGHSTVIVTQRYTRRTAGPLRVKGESLGFGAVKTKKNNVVKIGRKSR